MIFLTRPFVINRTISYFGPYAMFTGGRTKKAFFSSTNDHSTKNEDFKKVSIEGQSKPKQKPTLKVMFEMENGQQLTGLACHGDSLLDVVLNNELELDGFGACEGTLACSTCHLILTETDFNRLPNKITDEEMDMLDLAYGLTETSRLGCQIYMTKELDGLKVKVPPAVNDVRLR